MHVASGVPMLHCTIVTHEMCERAKAIDNESSRSDHARVDQTHKRRLNMTTQSKRAVSIKRFRDATNRTVNFIAYDNAKDAPIDGMSVHFDMKKMNAALMVEAALEGCNHSIGDAGALPSGATLKQKFDAMRERAEWLMSGASEWVGGRQEGEGTILFAALMLEKPERDAVKLREILRNKSAGDKAKMQNTERLRKFVDQIRKERNKGVDEDELFAGLDA
jgi:hypothetical protein